ncbi:hypothetical protein LTR87_015696 [Friedmanniomyces endolithicus]|nr:hypothetical protein LTR87_015696 [Friedmanniomyces endolithicus]
MLQILVAALLGNSIECVFQRCPIEGLDAPYDSPVTGAVIDDRVALAAVDEGFHMRVRMAGDAYERMDVAA